MVGEREKNLKITRRAVDKKYLWKLISKFSTKQIALKFKAYKILYYIYYKL